LLENNSLNKWLRRSPVKVLFFIDNKRQKNIKNIILYLKSNLCLMYNKSTQNECSKK
jgi:hypothetical protein